MALREFEDEHGGRWRVWDTVPERTQGLGEFREGWLTFDNGTDRRRLAPVPTKWAELPDERLLLLLRVAHAPGSRQGEGELPEIERRERERRERDRRLHERRRPAS